MNLIEQLGGYERAKHEFEMIKEMKPIYPGEIETNNRLLLEYRREHNIFEAGDKVVSEVYDLESIFVVSHADLMDEYIYSNKVFNGGKVFTTQDKLKGECRFLFEEIRHTTDEEIKAGKRLEGL